MLSTRFKSDTGQAVTALLIGVGSLFVGTAAAVGAVVAVVSHYGPQDQNALQNGPKNVLPPDQVLSYGG